MIWKALEEAYKFFEANLDNYILTFEDKGNRSTKLSPVVNSLGILKKLFISESLDVKEIESLMGLLDDTVSQPVLDKVTINRMKVFVKRIKIKVDGG